MLCCKLQKSVVWKGDRRIDVSIGIEAINIFHRFTRWTQFSCFLVYFSMGKVNIIDSATKSAVLLSVAKITEEAFFLPPWKSGGSSDRYYRAGREQWIEQARRCSGGSFSVYISQKSLNSTDWFITILHSRWELLRKTLIHQRPYSFLSSSSWP